ncbi:MAG: hypothetical protein WCJ30_14100, partial [Deltaproteobacteria bacterium]
MTTLRARLLKPFDNPVLRRELKLVTRRGHFEWIVFVLTVGMTLVIASVAGRVNAGVHPATIGGVLFQTFFGLAHGLVLVAGPAVAASSIAAEREGHTYEALALTGMASNLVARGKFLAAVTHVGSYVLALAPVGALPFLFGGVSALAVLIAFAMLFVVTALATLLGLAISARLSTTRSALITSVIGGAALAFIAYQVVGESLGNVVCEQVGVRRPGTIWLPILLAEANLGALRVAVLTLGPLVLAALAGWFLFEVCVANLSDVSADRTTGLKRWFAVSTVVLTGIAAGGITSATDRSGRSLVAIGAIAAYTVFALLCAFVFQGDEIIAPRRVRLMWKAGSAGVLRRFFGPGVTTSAALQLGCTALAIGAISVAGLALALDEEYGPAAAPLGIVAVALPASIFILFAVGLAMWLRVRYGGAVGRVVLALTLLVLCLAPYAVASILGGAEQGPDSLVPMLAAPSPVFALDVARRMVADQFDLKSIMVALGCTAFYAVAGIGLLSAAALKADRLVATLDADAARMDALIADEDARRSSAAPVPVAPVVALAATIAHAPLPMAEAATVVAPVAAPVTAPAGTPVAAVMGPPPDALPVFAPPSLDAVAVPARVIEPTREISAAEHPAKPAEAVVHAGAPRLPGERSTPIAGTPGSSVITP